MHIACLNQDPGLQAGKLKGARVHIAAMREAFSAMGAQVLTVEEARGLPGDQRALAALESAHGAQALDVVYERYALGARTGARFAHAHALAHVLEINAPLIDEERRFRSGAELEQESATERELFRDAALLLCVSQGVAQYALAAGADPARMLVRANGVDAALFRPRTAACPARALYVPDGRFALGFHGRLRPWHGFERIVAALRVLLQRELDVHLVLVGEGDFASYLTEVPTERVTRVGWLAGQDLARAVAAFDALPLGYGSELPCYFSPLKLAEAMAAGVVPVVPALGDLEQTVHHEVDGLVYEADAVGALSDALERLIREPWTRAALAQAARQQALGLCWTRIARDVLLHLGLVTAEHPS